MALVVGQETTSTAMPGFIRVGNSFITINAPSGSTDTVNAQSINNHGQIVGFYVGNDGQDHGFMAQRE